MNLLYGKHIVQKKINGGDKMPNIKINSAWCNQMRIRYDFNNMMAKFIGDKNGICEDEIDILGRTIFETIFDLKTNPKEFMRLIFDEELLQQIKDYNTKIKGKFDNILVIGIGGSALGGITLCSALKHSYYNLLLKKERKHPRILFFDNIDPDQLTDILNVFDLKKTLVNVITKSGNTVETMSSFLIIKEKIKKNLGKNYIKNIVITTDAEKGELRRIAKEEKITSFQIPDGVGGRFSVFSATGLLPASLVGIDIEEFLAGARFMNEICLAESIWENPAAVSAALQFLTCIYKKMNMLVMMPYSYKLRDVADWYRQLWAESLGKKYSINGNIINTGSTPIKALGVTDQHSQLQLYMEGPYDKTILFIHVDKFSSKISIPKQKKGELEYLSSHSLNELMDSEMAVTEYALLKEKRANATIYIPEINPFTIGQLLYFLELQTAIAGDLFKVNTYDQPGVESGKNLLYGLFNRKGYEEYGKEFSERMKKNKKYVI